MIEKKSLIFVFLFMFLFSMSFISADTCEVVPASECIGGNTVLELYSNSNSHGQIYDSLNLDYVLCCDFAGTHDCDSTNKVLGLSATTNAHAEIPSLDNYATDVCYGDLSCIGTQEPSLHISEYPLTMVSLTEDTNAHIGAYADYDFKILCKRASVVEPPTTNGYWAEYNDYLTEIDAINISQSEFVGGFANTLNTLRIVVGDTGETLGTAVKIDIYEKDEGTGSNDDFITTISATVNEGGEINVAWTPTYDELNNSDPEYIYKLYFKTIINGQENSYRDKILNLRVLWDFSWSNADCEWLDFNKINNISQIIIPAEYIFDSNPETGTIGGEIIMGTDPKVAWELYFSNLVHAASSGLIGEDGTHIYFEVLETDDSRENSIRTFENENPLIGILNSYSGIAIAPWEITPEDLSLANVDSEGIYDFYFRVMRYDGAGFSCARNLRVNVTWNNLTDNLVGSWLNFDGDTINEITFDADNLGDPASELNTVKLSVDGFPITLEGSIISFEIYQQIYKYNSHCFLFPLIYSQDILI